MGFRTGAYATIWSVEDQGNFTKVQLSTSRKNKQTDQYETDFSGFVRFIATAHTLASDLKARDRIKIGDCDVTTTYNKETKVGYTNYAMFSFEKQDESGRTTSSSATPKEQSAKPKLDVDENGFDENSDDLPF